jgi:hypothetical protein
MSLDPINRGFNRTAFVSQRPAGIGTPDKTQARKNVPPIDPIHSRGGPAFCGRLFDTVDGG